MRIIHSREKRYMTKPSTANLPTITGKEEGELSTSDEEVQVQPMQTSTRAPLTEHVSVPSANTYIQRPQATVMIKKNQAVSSTSTHGKKFPLRVDDSNLVIQFSDGDSESDSEGRSKTLKVQPKETMSVSRNRNLSTLKGGKQIDNRVTTKKAASSSGTFSHAAASKVSKLSFAKEMKANKNIYTFQRKVNKDTRVPEQTVDPKSNELKDLRQQIALRELKLKVAQPTNPKSVPVRKLGTVSDDGKQLESNEPAKKRLRVSGDDISLPVNDHRAPASAASRMRVLDIGTSLKPGIKANANSKHIERNCDEIDLPVTSQHITLGNTSTSDLPTSQVNHYEGGRCGQPALSPQRTSRELENMKNIDRSVASDQLPNRASGNHQPGNTTAPVHGQLSMLSLTNLEESLDRELDEAQERRRVCEIEERNALKVYRKAQRSLIEANARCAELYSKRENLSAQYGSLIVNDSRFLWPSTHHEHLETVLDKSTVNTDLATTTDIPQHTRLETNHRLNSEYDDSHPLPQNLGSEPCSDHGASTSDGLHNELTASRLCSPSSDVNILPDNESFPVDHESTEGNLRHQAENQNSLLLEASLRSKLFERLSMRADSRGGTCLNGDTLIDRGNESDVASERTQRDDSSPVSEKYQHNDFIEPASSNLQGSPSEPPVEQHAIEVQSSRDMESDKISPAGGDLSLSLPLQGPLFRSTIIHLKVPGSSITSLGPEYTLQRSGERQCRISTETPLYEEKIGFYSCNLKVEPFKSLCMYELRGRCNNDECSWQHFKDFSDDSLHQSLTEPHDSRVGSSLPNSRSGSKIFDVELSPTYLVSLDTLKVDSWSYKSALSQRHGQIWRKHLTVCLASSNSFYPARENEGRIEVLGNSRTDSSSFRTKHSLMNLLKQGSDAAVGPVETALNILYSEGYVQALNVLSRGLEADRTPEILWTVYLLIFYVYEGSNEKDMFSLGVMCCSRSYVVWLMYINYRENLHGQLTAYDAAISTLCKHASESTDRNYASGCILDLLLQMFNLFCISGNVSKAFERISKLQNPAPVSDEFSMILQCLTYSDKCVLWICCVYLVIYRKLPDSIVARFEMEKELVGIEWPSVSLVDDDDVKQLALKLFDKAMADGSGLLALNRALFMNAISELENCKDIVKESVKLYPSCLELKLLAVRLKSNEFEELLDQEPSEWIWNQYAECTLQEGNHDSVRELMSRWYVLYKNKTERINEGDDVMFGYINLSIYNLLQSDFTEASSAIDKALDAAATTHERFIYCLREHAVFQLINGTNGEFSINVQMRLLGSYLDRANSSLQPLSWKFISNEKPRVKKLVTNLLAPVSSELVVVNTVLEAWYGTSLVPEKLKQKELVDFVEAVLALVPSNYQLALSVCKLLRKDEGSVRYWAGLNMVSTVSVAIPLAPEYIWVEAGEILSKMNGFEMRAERFLSRGVSVYPMSVKLWRCYQRVAISIEERRGIEIEEEARKKGINLS